MSVASLYRENATGFTAGIAPGVCAVETDDAKVFHFESIYLTNSRFLACPLSVKGDFLTRKFTLVFRSIGKSPVRTVLPENPANR